MRVIESGYAMNIYCGNKIAISNKEGLQIFQGEIGRQNTYDEKQLKAILKKYISLHENGEWKGIDKLLREEFYDRRQG